MNIAIEIQKIQKDLELIKDENLINSIKSILLNAKNNILEQKFKPISVEEYKKRAEHSEEDIKMGRIVNVDDYK